MLGFLVLWYTKGEAVALRRIQSFPFISSFTLYSLLFIVNHSLKMLNEKF